MLLIPSQPKIMDINFMGCSVLATTTLLFLLFASATALRDVEVFVPAAVKRGDTARLHCLYDLEGDTLYAVKWYKGRREFYRYTPKENPAMKTFTVNGINVLRSASNESQVSLSHVQPSASGKYSCEVSADAPSFHTEIATEALEVVDTPEHRPIVHGIKPRYRIGDSLRANCTSKNSKPAANLTWYINDIPPNPLNVRTYRIMRDHKTDLETSLTGIQFVITQQHFLNNKLKIRCTSQIHDLYSQKTEKVIEQERPKPVHTPATNNNNIVHNSIPYDPYNYNYGDFYDKKDSHLTHIKGDVDSLSAGNSGHTISHCDCLHMKCLLILAALLLHRIANYDQLTAIKT
ncbi:fasciclin-3 isoform X2 [Contarinia nasturtii]|uniref:fasciclin-3 isoform X2 n=1 Tax=Contarinia nasturtii TaxID=265458 RepID=UPI0012D3B8CB|nr:fasciclin-3 isoform X2 [Contarinia nasturtii]